MKIIGIIPARYASSRFPGKALTLINGKPMIQLVYEQVLKTHFIQKVYIATDDIRIQKTVNDFGGNVLLTSEHHKSGTERCHEAAEILQNSGIEIEAIINIQGDEPLINPQQIDDVAQQLSTKEVQIATLVKKIYHQEELFDENVVKTIVDVNGKAIYFSRQAIPFIRASEKQNWIGTHNYFKHIGIYGYTAEVLKKLVNLKESPLEKAESLEQLRWLENGFDIFVKETKFDSIGIDTPEDLLKINKIS